MEPATPAPKQRSALNQLPKNKPVASGPKTKNSSRDLPIDDINKQSRFWCFTVNNYVAQFASLPPNCTYLVSGEEVGEEGTPHLQCYVELTRNQRRSYVSKMFPTAHISVRYDKSTGKDASDYCKKDGKFVEFGTLAKAPERGKRTDLTEIAALASGGASIQQIYESNPATYMRNYRAIQHVRQITHKPAPFRPNLTVRLYIGATRTGKSFHARVTEECFAKPVGKGLWFDGYDRHKKVVIDEFRGQYPLSDFLQITDPFQVQVETKGGHTWFEPDLIIITTNDHPSDMYTEHKQETRDAFFARFKEVWWWYAPRKYIVLNEQQRTEFFNDRKYPSVPIDAEMVVVPPRFQNSSPSNPPKKLTRQNATVSEELAPQYRWDHGKNSLMPANKRPRLSFAPEVDEDMDNESIQQSYDEAHSYPSQRQSMFVDLTDSTQEMGSVDSVDGTEEDSQTDESSSQDDSILSD